METLQRTPKSRRRSLFPHLENLEDSPKASLKTSPRKTPRSKKKELPAKFRQELPKRDLGTSPDEKENKMSPIKKSTFYGSYVPKFASLNNSFQVKLVKNTSSKFFDF